jgi:hypothetical protein
VIQFGWEFAIIRRQIHGFVGKLKIDMVENKSLLNKARRYYERR